MAVSAVRSTVVLLSVVVLLLLVPYYSHAQNKKARKSLIIRVEDFKEFKKLLRTKTNLLVICAQSEKATAKVMKLFEDVAEEMKGKATLAYINCGEDKKFCKKLKVSPSEFELRHYKDGEFNKQYDRKIAVKSMVNFLLDPTGDLPWEEDPTAADVVHISSEDSFTKLLRKEKQPILVMFYAPWCGFCKRLKPDFAAAAAEIKNEATLVGIDVDRPPLMSLRVQYNITGFPTLYYFEKGKIKFQYGGENNKAGILSWLKDPHPPKDPEKEAEWADEKSEVVHLKDDTFEDFIKENPSVLVMFYAPWCGHCKKMKPGYTEAAQVLKDEGVVGVLAAVDATKETKLGQEHGVRGFPTVKYFKNGEFAFDVNDREKDKIVEFMKDPKEPPPPPPPEPKWEEVESEVVHLTDDTFKAFLKKKKHCLIMFYAPWCGHCKKAKPEFMSAAEKFKDDAKVAFAAVDCTTQTDSCSVHDVTGYPTFKYFNYGKNPQKYMGGREENDFITFMRDPLNPTPTQSPPKTESMEDQWKSFNGYTDLAFLNSNNIDQVVAENKQVLVMFYAPWCGHCKKMKPAFSEAAAEVKKNKLGLLGAVDATVDRDLVTKYGIQGYPTLKLFKSGQVIDYNKPRTKDDLVSFMRSALPPRLPFISSDAVQQLYQEDFSTYTSGKQTTLVMFYDPENQSCLQAKTHFVMAAQSYSSDKASFAAVDCTHEQDLCKNENVAEYPAIYLYIKGEFLSKFTDNIDAGALGLFVENAPVPGKKLKKSKEKKKEEL